MPTQRSLGLTVLSLFGLFCGALSASAAPKVIPVKTPAQLQAAFGSVPDGGVIELAAGVYQAPAKGFNISNPGKGFTVRAAANAKVFLDGQGKGTILRYKNTERSRGKVVVFQDITFRNGFSNVLADAGAVSLSNSAATFVRSNFRNNAAVNRGGAISALFSSLTVQGGEFTDNRTNRPGHRPTSPGGAIYALDSTLTISDTRFLRNEAGWTGGAIYAFGNWTEPVTTPRSLVTVIRSTFNANRAVPDPCCRQSQPTAGGAIHVENHATLRVFASHFFDNAADNGGAIDAYRGIVEVNGSILLGNRTPAVPGRLGVGGAVYVTSNDPLSDPVNRRPARLTVTDSLLQGGVAPPATPANLGGCVAAEGDYVRAESGGGSLAENRAPVELRRTAFVDCDVQKSASAGGGFGGAVAGAMVGLTLDNSIVMSSDARVDTASGGGLSLQRGSTAVINATTFARDTAQRAGGALYLNGSAAQVTGSRFFRNEVSPGVGEAINESRGAAIFSIPQLGQPVRDVAGLVSGSVFSENAGIPIWDTEPPSGAPFNEMRYDNNQIYAATFGDRVYFHPQGAPGGANAPALNGLLLFHSGRPALDKGNGNGRLAGPPSLGALLATPPSLGTGSPAVTQSFLAYAWSGRSASIDGTPLTERTGLFPVSAPGSHTLMVDGAAVATVQLAASACTAATTLCLTKDRYRLEARWTDAAGNAGEARPVSLSDGTGYFWIGSEEAPALVVELTDESRLDAGLRLFRQRTDLGFTVTWTDTWTGATRTWSTAPEAP